MRQVWLIIPVFVLTVGFQNCSETTFVTRAPAKQVVETVSDEAPQMVEMLQKVDENFSLKGSAVALDVLWVIDNSGSMNEEAAHVRRNLNGFVNYIEQHSDTRFALISRSGQSGTQVSVSGTNQNRIQVNRTVGSKNAFRIVVDEVNNGALKNFFRAEASKVIIVVTDDESDLSAGDFMQQLGADVRPKVFAFAAFASKSESPCRAAYGARYFEAARVSGGKVFNVCDSDWTPHFDTLAKEIVDYGEPEVALQAGRIDSVLSVSVNDQVVPEDQYSLVGNRVRLSADALDNLDGIEFNIRVSYRMIRTFLQ